MQKIVTTRELAEFLDVSARRIQQYVKDGIIRNAGRGKFNLKEAVQDFYSYQFELERAKLKRKDASLDEAYRRKMLAEAELKEMEVEQKKGELIEKQEVIESWQKILNILKTRLLALPTQIAQEVAGLRRVNEIKKRIEKNVMDALNEISQYDG